MKEISKTSKKITASLRDYYSVDYLKTFKTFDDFLDDINNICEQGGTGKLLFIKEVSEYFTTRLVKN